MPRMPWIKMWTEEWLDGSIRIELTPEERSVWADLLAMAGRSRNLGIIQSNNNVPYSYEYLASRFQIPLELLTKSMKQFTIQGRIKETSEGIVILNWSKYQKFEKRRQKA